VLTEVKDGVMAVRMNRADKKNAITNAMYTQLANALKQASADSAVRVALITGTTGYFTSGNDLVDFLNSPPSDAPEDPVMVFMSTMSQFAKPLVAAVNGVAIGIGTTMLLHCDLVYAGENARFHFPFAKIGICPEFASTLLLVQALGHQRAAELTMLAEPFNAANARSLGLVNAVLPDAEVQAHALQQARKLAQQAPNALPTTKALLKRWPAEQVTEAIRIEAAAWAPMLHMPEAREAMSALMEKRKPDFSRFN
jgi:enoyl-CoA hydratase/carnithine racemase